LLTDFDLINNPRIYGEYVDMGAYENQNVLIVGVEENSLSAAEINLYNYPNPFNPTTKISFELNTSLRPGYAGQTETAENTELVIYNLKGQKVRTFSNLQINKSPNQQIVWNGTDDNNQPVSSGIYLFKLNIKNSPTGRMILLK